MQTHGHISSRGGARIRPLAFGQPPDTPPGRYGEVDGDFVSRANRIVAQAGVNSYRVDSVAPQPLIVHGQVIRGDGLTIVGNSNSVYGNRCKVIGNSNNLTGDDGTVTGNHNIITGARCSVDGTDNIIVTETTAPSRLRPAAPDYRSFDRARDRDRYVADVREHMHALLVTMDTRRRTGTVFPEFPPGYEDAPSTNDDAPTPCTICTEHIRAVIAIPCGHFAMCGTCCAKLKPEGRKDDAGLHMCPICQKGVSAFNRVFDS
jgi:hypothetical protein